MSPNRILPDGFPEDWLTAYLDNQLTRSRYREVEAALAMNPELVEMLEELKAARSVVKSLPAYPHSVCRIDPTDAASDGHAGYRIWNSDLDDGLGQSVMHPIRTNIEGSTTENSTTKNSSIEAPQFELMEINEPVEATTDWTGHDEVTDEEIARIEPNDVVSDDANSNPMQATSEALDLSQRHQFDQSQYQGLDEPVDAEFAQRSNNECTPETLDAWNAESEANWQVVEAAAEDAVSLESVAQDFAEQESATLESTTQESADLDLVSPPPAHEVMATNARRLRRLRPLAIAASLLGIAWIASALWLTDRSGSSVTLKDSQPSLQTEAAETNATDQPVAQPLESRSAELYADSDGASSSGLDLSATSVRSMNSLAEATNSELDQSNSGLAKVTPIEPDVARFETAPTETAQAEPAEPQIALAEPATLPLHLPDAEQAWRAELESARLEAALPSAMLPDALPNQPAETDFAQSSKDSLQEKPSIAKKVPDPIESALGAQPNTGELPPPASIVGNAPSTGSSITDGKQPIEKSIVPNFDNAEQQLPGQRSQAPGQSPAANMTWHRSPSWSEEAALAQVSANSVLAPLRRSLVQGGPAQEGQAEGTQVQGTQAQRFQRSALSGGSTAARSSVEIDPSIPVAVMRMPASQLPEIGQRSRSLRLQPDWNEEQDVSSRVLFVSEEELQELIKNPSGQSAPEVFWVTPSQQNVTSPQRILIINSN